MHKKIWATLNYIEYFLILTFTVTRCISNSAFAFLLGITTGIMSSAIGFRNCAISAGLKKYKSIINKKKKKHDKIGLLVNYHRSLFSKALNDSYISHDDFVSVNNVSKGYGDMKEIIKVLKT